MRLEINQHLKYTLWSLPPAELPVPTAIPASGAATTGLATFSRLRPGDFITQSKERTKK
jgi:hypothetical protein